MCQAGSVKDLEVDPIHRGKIIDDIIADGFGKKPRKRNKNACKNAADFSKEKVEKEDHRTDKYGQKPEKKERKEHPLKRGIRLDDSVGDGQIDLILYSRICLRKRVQDFAPVGRERDFGQKPDHGRDCHDPGIEKCTGYDIEDLSREPHFFPASDYLVRRLLEKKGCVAKKCHGTKRKHGGHIVIRKQKREHIRSDGNGNRLRERQDGGEDIMHQQEKKDANNPNPRRRPPLPKIKKTDSPTLSQSIHSPFSISLFCRKDSRQSE